VESRPSAPGPDFRTWKSTPLQEPLYITEINGFARCALRCFAGTGRGLPPVTPLPLVELRMGERGWRKLSHEKQHKEPVSDERYNERLAFNKTKLK
jgi:hypothetical protein